ncbi:MAG: hypothetical protein IBJ03_03270 [Gemmatimonadaceae bacterium]|nr:hypothetical protein [Gemmatimonadaceae bacterium]
MNPTPEHFMVRASRWLDQIEERAYSRLRQLRQRGLWDGKPPVPIEHLIEHILELNLRWEVIQEESGESVFACLRPATREIVLNEIHRERFQNQPGLERFSIAHEAGHADVFAVVREADQIGLLVGLGYRPQRRSATNGEVFSLHTRLRELPRAIRTEVMQGLAARERERRAAGEDSPLERRAVDHYAAVLLMPAEQVRAAAAAITLRSQRDIRRLADSFLVSTDAMRIRLQELGLIHSVAKDGTVQITDPATRLQGSLF